MEITYDLFGAVEPENRKAIEFSSEAQAVFDAGRELWKYYHKTIYHIPILGEAEEDVNAALYDIRAYFQGRNEQGKMNNKSEDERYMTLIGNLREKLQQLAEKIEPKVYAYGFLKS